MVRLRDIAGLDRWRVAKAVEAAATAAASAAIFSGDWGGGGKWLEGLSQEFVGRP